MSKNKDIKTVLSWKAEGNKIVFTNGCFDILHRGHIDYLQEAACHGDKLVIGLNSDSSVRKLKGKFRPVQSQDDRKALLLALRFVDAVIIFDEETPQSLISELLPEVLVKGGDYTVHSIAGADEVIASGGKVIIIPLTKGRGTTDIIKKIQSSHLREMS